MNPIVNEYIPHIRQILLKNRVDRAFLFGSACRNDFNDKSDIDLLIKFQEDVEPEERGDLWWNIYFSLENVLNRQIDLLTENSLKNPYLISEIEKSRIAII